MKKINTILFFLTLVITVISNPLFAGDSTSVTTNNYQKGAGIYYQIGSIIRTHPYVKGDNPYQKPYGLYQSVSARYYIHTDGRKMWQQLYGYPTWGFGFYKGFIAHDEYLGNPAAVYSFINLPLKRWNRWSIGFETGFGISFNWKTHDFADDHYSYPIGSYSTVFFDVGFNATFFLGKHFNLTTGISYTHFSNGAVKLPNLGVNMFAPRIELEYAFGERPEFQKMEIPRYKKEWEWLILIASSMKQVGFYYVSETGDSTGKTFNYPVVSLSTAVNRQISHKVKFGGGIDISYNEAYAADTVMVDGVPHKAPFNPGDKILIGIFPSFELVLNKLSFIAQPGYYIYKK
ncbi:MAG: acyloxyacyl hydrolase, partial [Chlorobi bacterium]|nr:acyloxyacyl hydrolase [Chlorobiota bacterium]